MRGLARLGALAAMAATAAACATAQARTPVPVPMLEPPDAPRRIVIPSPVPDPIAIVDPPATAVELPDPPAPTAPPPRGRSGAPPTQPPPPATTTDPQVLRTSADVARAERETRTQLQIAERALNTVRRGELGADGRAQFDEVQRFMRSSEEALKVKNYLLARQLADKAALLARLLVRGGPPSAP